MFVIFKSLDKSTQVTEEQMSEQLKRVIYIHLLVKSEHEFVKI